VGSNDVTWQVLTVCLTLVGLVGTGMLWKLRGPVAGLRALALSLLPAAASLTGTLRLVWEIGDAVVSWGVRFAFSPVVWLGLVLAGVSVTLLVLAGALSRGRSGRRERGELDTRASRAPATGTAPGGSPSAEDAEIEAILKRHGIT
jgi:hypothetical protein